MAESVFALALAKAAQRYGKEVLTLTGFVDSLQDDVVFLNHLRADGRRTLFSSIFHDPQWALELVVEARAETSGTVGLYRAAPAREAITESDHEQVLTPEVLSRFGFQALRQWFMGQWASQPGEAEEGLRIGILTDIFGEVDAHLEDQGRPHRRLFFDQALEELVSRCAEKNPQELAELLVAVPSDEPRGVLHRAFQKDALQMMTIFAQKKTSKLISLLASARAQDPVVDELLAEQFPPEVLVKYLDPKTIASFLDKVFEQWAKLDQAS